MQNKNNTKNKPELWKIVLAVTIVTAIITAVGYFIYTINNIEPVTGGKLMMSTLITQSIYDRNHKKAEELLEVGFEQLKNFEEHFSMYIDSSEISMINKNAGKEMVEVSEQTYNLLKECVKYGDISDGRFDITIAPVTLEWGINTDHPTIPSDERLAELLELVNYKDILFDDDTMSVGLAREGMMIDLGAVAKGASCDIVSRYYKEYDLQGSSLSIGGNVLTKGYADKSKGCFSVGIRNPRGNQNSLLGVVDITDTTISTSGDYERFFVEDGIRYHHIFDTKTAAPAKTDLIAVSIVSDSGSYAEFLSTYLFVMGKDYVLDIIENKSNTDYEFIAVDSDLNVYTSEGIRDIFTPNANLTDFSFIDLPNDNSSGDA